MKRTALLLAAAACFAGAVLGPMEALADRSFAWHMAQHLVLLIVVPLLVLSSQPFPIVRRLIGDARTVALLRATRPLHAIAFPPIALAIFVATLWGTHFSHLYEAALGATPVHAAEHALYLFAGFVFWLPVLTVAPLRPIAYPARLLYLMVALPQGALLAIALGAARRPLYEHYARIMPAAQAVADQQNAAAVMWIAGGLAIFIALLATVGTWAARELRAADGASY
ncbi:MAG TPA: cytochrome c oxidase assembly protein [Candidatus Baltobacteraceae bacterium]